MIGYIKGAVIGAFAQGRNGVSLVIWPSPKQEPDHCGIGYSVLVSDVAAAQYPVNEVVALWLYQVHNENDSYYIGLKSRETLEFFLQLLQVPSIGPKSALHLVDAMPLETLKEAIESQNVQVLSKIPGIGKKSAAKIVLELAGKLVAVDQISKPTSIGVVPDKYRAVVATLVKLGYSRNSAKSAVQSVQDKLDGIDSKDVGAQVKLVLNEGGV
jgi:Holliday junction DNA helicase RuvA